MLRRVATISACTLVVSLAGATAATADSRTLVDARGDVWAMDFPDPGQNTQVPERQQGDITRTVFVHNNRQVVIRTKFAELNRVGQMSVMAVRLRTNAGKVQWIALWAGPTRKTDRWHGTVTRRDGVTPLECATHRIDYAENVAEVRIPRSCLGDPRWVQGSMAAATIARGGTAYTDNPVTEGPSVHLPSFTTRIRKG